ncbi:Protein OS-9 [Oleoguttula sp. CCFEE 5521]
MPILLKHLLALPALLRVSLVLASQHAFSVQDDILAFPQYEIKFTEQYIPEDDVPSKLRDGSTQPMPSSGTDIGHHAPESSWDDREQDGSEEQKLEYEVLLLDQQRYLCSIPIVAPPEQTTPAENATQTQADTARELARANERGWELLSAMHGQCTYFISGWWSYRFCYGEGVRQFHQLAPGRGGQIYPPVEDPGVEGYSLGMYEGAGEKMGARKRKGEGERVAEGKEVVKVEAKEVGELVTKGESRYLVQRLDGGTTCDLTGKSRRIEVQFHCNPSTGSDRISLIKETATCAYLMVIQTPRLCNDIAFLPPQIEAANAITCAPILSPSEAEAHAKDLAAPAAASEPSDAEIWAANPDAAVAFGIPVPPKRQVAGDIEVGGHAIVPKGVKLEKSAIVGGGKETYIETIADSEGKMLGAEELEKRQLGKKKDVEAFKRKLEEVAKGGKWKLDVVETVRGREYRGVIDDGSEEEGTGGNGQGSGEGAAEAEAGGFVVEGAEPVEGDAGEGEGRGEGAENEERQQGSQEEYYHEEL